MKQLSTTILALTLAACSSGSDAFTPAPPTGGGGPALTAADAPNTSPCPNQSILTNASQLATFQTALLNGTFLYKDVPFVSGDPNIYVKKCGLDANWNPANNTDEVAPFATPVTIAGLFQTGNAGICSAGFSGNFAAEEGFPVAGTYRHEFKVTHSGTTYLVRTRTTVIGTAAGDSFASRGITNPTDIANTLGYEVNGANTAHANVLPAIAAALMVPDATVMLDILDAPGGNTLLSAQIEFICVAVV